MMRLLLATALSALVATPFLVASCGGRFDEDKWEHDPAALVGVHRNLPCQACHPADEPLGPVSPDCESCHEVDRPKAHFEGESCSFCHTPYSWYSLDHTFLPLADAHDIHCRSCHTVYTVSFAGLNAACSSCHEGVRPDNHFDGIDCGDCHVPTTWGEASYDHTFSVPHHGASACVECHIGIPDDYTIVSCFDSCHEHNEDDTNDDHDEVAGYDYASEACIDCHPTGN